MKRYSAVFNRSHYSHLAKDFDDKSEAINYWKENNGGKHDNGGVIDNSLPAGSYRWIC